MVRVETLSENQLTAKMSVLHCMMMSHGGELLARYCGFLQSHHESLGCKNRLLGLVWKFLASDEFSIVYGELISLAASAGFERGLSMHWTKDEFAVMLKKMAHFVPGVQGRLAEAPPSLLVAQTDYTFLNKISKHVDEPLSVILQLEPKKLARLANARASRDARVSPPIVKESTVTPASESLELSTNVILASSVVASEQNEDTFVQGTSYVLDDVAEVTMVGSESVSSGPTDVVVALSTGEKGDGSLPSFAADETTAANLSRA
ncbi:hypothetical protein Tco_0937858 [Tanacetum coccineum]|uniref:Uncharacterized protein n=1 Tax=Tanacetum coccineum TaxID=301880 RepID=A0ABQ5DI79_9ASTR